MAKWSPSQKLNNLEVNFFGNWPNQVPAFFSHTESEKFRDAVKVMCSDCMQDALVVHGTGGVGKTTTAVFSIRQHFGKLSDPSYSSFSHVLWLNVGEMTRDNDFADKKFYGAVGELLVNCDLLSDNSNLFESIKSCLQNHSAKLLFVLDDVFDTGVLRCMSKLGKNVKVIALTRNLTKAIYRNSFFHCNVLRLEALPDDQIEEMLFTFYQLSSKGLDRKRHVRRLAKICLGLPLIASVVCRHFQKLQSQRNITSNFWALIRNFKLVNASEVVIDKFGNCDEAQLRISKLITLSPELDNSEDLRETLYSFLIFPAGQEISSSQLQIIWKLASLELVYERCQEAVDASLLRVSGSGYVLHELLHRALMERAFSEIEDCSDLTTLRQYLVNESLELQGRNSLEWAIEQNQPSLIQLILDYAHLDAIMEVCRADEKPLTKLARKCNDHEFWLRNVGQMIEASMVTEHLCMLLDLCLNQDGKFVDENMLGLLAKSMERPVSHWYENVFLTAAKLGCLAVVQLLTTETETQPFCSNCDVDGNNALILAVTHGKLEMVQCLIEKQLFDVNAVNSRGECAISFCPRWALGRGLEMLETLCSAYESSIDVNIASLITGNATLHEAVISNQLDQVQFLVEKMAADITLQNTFNRANPLELALGVFGHREIGEFLLTQQNATMSQNWVMKAASKAESSGDQAFQELVNDLERRFFHCGSPVGRLETIQVPAETNIHYIIVTGQLSDLQSLFRENPAKWIAGINTQNQQGHTPLMLACFLQNVPMVDFLLANGAASSIDSQDVDGCSALINASLKGCLQIVQMLLQHGASVDLRRSSGSTALRGAIMNGHFDEAKILIEHGADVNSADNKGWTPLLSASELGFQDLCQLLLDNGARLEQASADGSTSLMVACATSHPEIVDLILRVCSNEDFINALEQSKWTALMFACQSNCLQSAKMLIARGRANVHPIAKNGLSAITVACQNGSEDLIRLLISEGADVDAIRHDNGTPLHITCHRGLINVAELLLDFGANADLADRRGWTPLMIASHLGNDDLIQLLTDRGANVHLTEQGGFTALHIAIHNEHLSTATLLLERGSPVDWQSLDGKSPLIDACLTGRVDLVRLILEYDADINLQEANGSSPLSIASSYGFYEVCRLLLDHGADPNLQNAQGATALMFAADEGFTSIVTLLIERGADITLRTMEDTDAISMARENGYREIVKLLNDAYPE